jgi:hypothetical protein
MMANCEMRTAGLECADSRVRSGDTSELLQSDRKRDTENALEKRLVYGLLAMTFAGPALAGERYVEVWNPPEARGVAAAHTKKATMSAHKSVKQRHVSLYAAASHTRRKPGLTTPAQSSVPDPVPATSTPAASAAPTFDDIPRQIAPEGDVLRVTGRWKRFGVER